MENKNYYEILEISQNATPDEITAAKNQLAKKYHPDANIKHGIDTTKQMQEILEAYRVLSNPKKKAKYDQKINAKKSVMQTFDLFAMQNSADSSKEEDPSNFVCYWKAAGSLYEIIEQSEHLLKSKEHTSHLTKLSIKAVKHILLLRSASIPEKYWIPDSMNWLLFTWYQNQNYTIEYLLTLYEMHVKKSTSPIERFRLQKKSLQFQHSLKRLMKY